MANVKYGVNIIPRTNNTYTIGNSDYKWANIYTVQLNGVNVANLATNSVATSSAAGLMSAADKAKLDTLSAFNATDYTVNIATTDWVNNSYTWTNSAVTSTAYIIVNFTESVKDYVKGTLDYTKVTGGVQFNVESTPTGTITLVIGVIDGASGASASGSGADIDDTVTALNKTWSSSKIDEQVIISSTQPSATSNKLWISNDSGTEVTVPTYSEFETLADSVITDIQLNGTSIVNNNIANIPLAGQSSFGIVKTGAWFGTGMTDGTLYVNTASDSDIKTATQDYKPISPLRQHKSIFYGLATAAGDSTQKASSNAVGIYTPEAKIAIQKMLGVYEAPWELIRTDSFTNATAADYTISLDANQQPFQLTDIALILTVPTQESAASVGNYGIVSFYQGTTVIRRAYMYASSSLSIPANSNFYVANVLLEHHKELLEIRWTEWAQRNGHKSWISVNGEATDGYQTAIGINSSYFDSITISTILGTMNYRLFGKRKWN